MPAWLRPSTGGVLVEIVVQPRASRTRIVGEHGDRLKLQIAAPPVDGEANDAVIAFLAATFSVPKRDVELVAGATARRKTVLVRGVDEATAAARLRA
ncbi:DUF167 domain-containing protein [Vulgatibacter sp.]|uniref:DUF167 domain-containing protein n=1 Tax=Vulgatibacter sp. TaxID=1971226 RepID=UPI003563E834